jgi:hypothetical protein
MFRPAWTATSPTDREVCSLYSLSGVISNGLPCSYQMT